MSSNQNKFTTLFSLIKQSLKGEEHDYTQGNVKTAILLLSIPMILELSLESVFAVVDIYFVGHLPNADVAVATVGLTEAVISLVYTIGIGLSVGATAIVARRVGEKDFTEASKSGAQAITVSLIVAVFVAILGVCFASDILRLMGAQPEVIQEGTVFAQIIFASSPSIILLFMINGIFRGAGDAAMAMRSLWIASMINIVLCPLLIYGYGPFPELGLVGAAVATTIGRTIGVLYQCYHLFAKSRTIKIYRSYFKPNIEIIKSLLSVSMPAMLQFFIQSGSWIVLTYIVSITGSTDASAGYQIAIRNVVFFILPAWGLSNAAATLVGQNLGAKQPERAEQSVLLTTKYNVLFMSFVTLLFVCFSEFIISFYTEDKVILAYGSQALRIIGFGYIFYGIGMVMIQSLNGAGDTKTPTWINIFCFWMIQIPLAWFLAVYMKLGPLGAFIAIPSAETVLALLAFYYFKRGKWKTVEV
ncbi:MATE family efflux transporter [Flavobacterium sp. IMCC34852]|uniref:Multidrug-efflux transporter n=1 Tax=Flavobacterium rivulicola TaxID=2732161 RepID=A0A7Y3RAR8_9FLAO|nr:MATE family efflux transporter [Flavobacterium sp. IMCC34852]NNT73073.1 MATE family efflux transporter [Flavobacterium sp. IMCC34852]